MTKYIDQLFIDVDGKEAIASNFLDEHAKPFYRVSIFEGGNIDVYCNTVNGQTLWFNRDTHAQTPMATKVGQAIEVGARIAI